MRVGAMIVKIIAAKAEYRVYMRLRVPYCKAVMIKRILFNIELVIRQRPRQLDTAYTQLKLETVMSLLARGRSVC